MRDKLQCVRAILQNRQTEAARIVTGLTTYATLSSLYAETWWEKLNTRREIRKLSALFYNIVKGDTPDYLSDLLPRTVNQANNYNLRNTNNFTIPGRVSFRLHLKRSPFKVLQFCLKRVCRILARRESC
jgi:hypothetical protein